MKLNIKVIPNAKRCIYKDGKVYLTAPAQEGKANKMLIEFLAEHFNISKSKVKIIRGHKSRIKVVEIAQ